MRTTPLVLAVTLLFAGSGAGRAAATTLDLTWDSCTGPVARTVVPGTFARILVSALGQAEPHKGYEFSLTVADVDGTLPDAWRFDAEGCQGPGRISIDHLVPSAVGKTCPSFQGASASFQVKSFTLAGADPDLPPGSGLILLRNTYPAGNYSSASTVRYMLGSILFDHFDSVNGTATEPGTCGSLERGVCTAVLPARSFYVTPDDRVVPFTIGNGSVTANGGACSPVPASSSSWGQIKAVYRR